MNVDLRRYLPREMHPVHAANLVGLAPLLLQPRDSRDFGGVLTQIRDQLRDQRGPDFGRALSHHGLDAPGVMAILGAIPFGVVRRLALNGLDQLPGTPRVVISDLGASDPAGDLWGPLALEGSYCSVGILKLSAVFVGISTCGSQLTLSIGSGPESFVSQLVDRVDHHLCQFAGWPAGTARRVEIRPATERERSRL